MELNPNHPVTSAMSEQWHKIVALLMMKFGEAHVEITEDEIVAFAQSELAAVTIQEKDGVLHMDLISWEEAERLARQEGGLPV